MGLVVAVPGTVLVLAGALAAGPAAAAAVALGYGALVAWWFTRQSRAALAGLGTPRRLEEADAPRLANLTGGIAAGLSLQPPTLMVLADGEPNAFACWSRGPLVLVTQSLLETYTRTELEAVVAHCLIRLARGERRRAVVGAALGGLAGPAGVLRHHDVDLRVVALTRYPPALAAAIGKARPAGGARAGFWFVPAASGAAAAQARVRALADL